MHLNNERYFLKDFKNVESSKKDIELRLRQMSDQYQEKSMRVDYLEKVRKDQEDQEKVLKKSIDIKSYAYEELSREFRNVKAEYM
jgi:hypothetical protein